MARTVLVTGGGTGIGRAIAAAFAAGGDQVFITGRREAVLREAAAALGSSVTPIVCDATDPEQVVGLRKQLPGQLDVLVNNAGGNQDFVAGPPADLREVAEQFRANLSTNLLSAVLTTGAVEEAMADGGAIVQLSSFAADRGAGSYGAAKAALNAWNVMLASRVGPRGITANVVSPGYIVETEFFARGMPPEFHQERVEETMLKRAGDPSDIAGVVHFLASPAARHITAQVINVNGGARTTR